MKAVKTSAYRQLKQPFFDLKSGRLVVDGGDLDPVPDYVAIFRLDGTDSIPRVGGDDFRLGKECPIPKASMFDGSTQYFNADAYASIFTGLQTGFSVSAWVNTLNTSSDGEIMGAGASAAGNNGFYIRILSGGLIQVSSDGNFNNSTGATVNDGVWHHIVITYDGTDIRYYIDGALDSTVTSTFNTLAPTTFKIGVNSFASTAYQDGRLDNIRVYDRVLDLTDVQAIEAYQCDYRSETDDTSAIDVYNAQDSTTITEAASLVSQWDSLVSGGINMTEATNKPSTGNFGVNNINYIEADGVADKLTAASQDIGTTGNVMFVFDSNIGTVTGQNESIVSRDGTTNIRFKANNASEFRGIVDTNAATNVAATGFPYSGYNLWSIVYDFSNSTLSLYHNGTLEASTSDYTTKLDQTANFLAFVDSTGANFLDCGMSNIVITNSVDATTRQNHEGVIAWRNGQQASLDASHPYKTIPPER
jgi:hypothetical protein